jgi:hypothetical protein
MDRHVYGECEERKCDNPTPWAQAIEEAQEIIRELCESRRRVGVVDGSPSDHAVERAIAFDRAKAWLHSRGVKLSYEKEASK